MINVILFDMFYLSSHTAFLNKVPVHLDAQDITDGNIFPINGVLHA